MECFLSTVGIVGLQRTGYTVMEDVGVVEACVIVYEPNENLDCPISFPFDVSLSTEDDSAGITIQYVLLTLTALVLHTQCHPWTISACPPS